MLYTIKPTITTRRVFSIAWMELIIPMMRRTIPERWPIIIVMKLILIIWIDLTIAGLKIKTTKQMSTRIINNKG